MLIRYANVDKRLRKVYVIRVSRQADLFGDIKFVSTVSTSASGSNPFEVETAKLLKDKPRQRARKVRDGN